MQQQLQSREDNDLVMPLQPKSKFLSMIIKNKPLSQQYKSTLICLSIGFFFFFVLSLSMIGVMSSAQNITVPYYRPEDNTCLVQGTNCSITFTLSVAMPPPIYFSYQLDNFYQNQRLFIQSKNSKQLAGGQISSNQQHTCSPFITNSEMGVTKSYAGVALDPSAVASPCGSFAKAYFNDSFVLSYSGAVVPMQESGIVWPGEVGGQYARGPNSNQTQWIDPEDEHFISWMRPAGLSNFKKLWAIINQPLQVGTYTLTVQNNYNTQQWQGGKYIVLTTIGPFGGQNYTLPVIMLLMSLLCLVAAILIARYAYRYHKLVKRQ